MRLGRAGFERDEGPWDRSATAAAGAAAVFFTAYVHAEMEQVLLHF